MTRLPDIIFSIVILMLMANCSHRYQDDVISDCLASTEVLLDSVPDSLPDYKYDSVLVLMDSISANCHLSPQHEALVHYLTGAAEMELCDYPSAIKSLLYAEKESKEAGDWRLLAKTRYRIMRLYGVVGGSASRCEYAQKAAEAYELCGDTARAFDLLDSSKYYLIAYNDTEGLKDVAGWMERLSRSYEDSVTAMVVRAYAKHEDYYGDAFVFSLEAILDSIYNHGDWESLVSNEDDVLFPNDICDVSILLHDEGWHVAAKELLDKYAQYYTFQSEPNSRGMFHLAKHLNVPHPLNGIPITRRYLYNQFQPMVDRAALDFYYEEQVLKDRTIRYQRNMLVIVCICGGLAVAALGLLLWGMNQHRRKREAEMMQSAVELKTVLNQTEEKWLTTLSNLCNTYYEVYAKETVRSKVAKEALATIEEVACKDEFFAGMETKLNDRSAGLMRLFRERMPRLREDEYRLFMLNALGFSVPTICLLLHEKREVVYNRRVRLRMKIQESDIAEKDLFAEAL